MAATGLVPHAASAGMVKAVVYGGDVSLPTLIAPAKKVTRRIPKSSLGTAVSRTVSPRRYCARSALTVTAGAPSSTGIGAGTTGNCPVLGSLCGPLR